MSTGDQLIRWTVRLAVLLYVFYAARRIGGHSGSLERSIWTVGCALMWLHTAFAFHIVYHWSHAAAYAATAEDTAAVTGLDWGGGLYVNYLFLIVWTFDAAWLWLRPNAGRPLWIEAAVHGFLAFVAINGAIVFAEGLVRWVSVAGLIGLAALWLWRRQPRNVSSEAGGG